jgi:hypothetical protein
MLSYTVPMFAFLTFGTQRVSMLILTICVWSCRSQQDILDAWFFWRKSKDIGSSGPDPIPTTGLPSFIIPIV